MAGKARVHELAKELGVTSKEVLARLSEQGEFVKSASSTVEAPVARRLSRVVRRRQARGAEAVKAPQRLAAAGAPRPKARRAPERPPRRPGRTRAPAAAPAPAPAALRHLHRPHRRSPPPRRRLRAPAAPRPRRLTPGPRPGPAAPSPQPRPPRVGNNPFSIPATRRTADPPPASSQARRRRPDPSLVVRVPAVVLGPLPATCPRGRPAQERADRPVRGAARPGGRTPARRRRPGRTPRRRRRRWR